MTTHPYACEERLDAPAFLCRLPIPRKMLRGILCWGRKSVSARVALTGIRQIGEVASFAA